MRLTPLEIPEVLLVEPTVHEDNRGFFLETWHAEKFRAAGLDVGFVQDNHSRSVQHTLRGLHYQLVEPQGKLVRVVTGEIFDVAVDLRRSSPTFGCWVGATLRETDFRMLWIPPGFAHGFLALSAQTDVLYKCTTPYQGQHDRTLRWNDPAVGVQWPLPSGIEPRLSPKDASGVALDIAETYP
ncbi:MAG: dTDP-4-dehydrorhamnose 3,5-epimerase [Gemmatimonadales bacterium]